MTTPDPIRWLDSDEPSLTAEQRSALQACATRGPSEEQRARLLSRLEGAPVASSATSWLSRRRWWWGASSLIVLGALVLTQLQPNTPVAERKAESAPARPLLPAPAPPVAIPASQPPAPPSSGAPAAPTARVATRAREPKPVSTAAAQDPAAELALLTPARQLLATTPARSLTLAEEHARRFPRGVFAEERAFLRIEALLRLGQRGHADSEARVFRRDHPQSTYLERLESLLPTVKPSDGAH